MITALLVLTRIVANPVSNVFQKQLTRRSASPLFIIAATHALLAAGCVPLLLGVLRMETARGFWSSMLVAAVLAVAGNVLLVFALQLGG